MKYFKIDQKTTVDELKYQYREHSKKLHPDAGGDSLEFIAMGEEFRSALNTLSSSSNSTERDKAQELLKEILNSIIQDPKTIYRIVDLFTDKNRLDCFIKNTLLDSLRREILKK